jgi:hypothetical protein
LNPLIFRVSEAIEFEGSAVQRGAVIGEGYGAGRTRNLAENLGGAYRVLRIVHIGPEQVGGTGASTVDN